MKIKAFFDKPTSTLTYVVWDEASKQAILLDPVLDYDPASSKIETHAFEKLIAFISNKNLKPIYSLETHAHADHLSSAQLLKKKFPALKIGIGKNISKVQKIFKNIFNLQNFNCDGSQFDILLDEHSFLEFGNLKLTTLFTPGHTPACAAYKIHDVLFTGDTIFMPDYGTGRCDFPGGSADDLYDSILNKIYSLPDSTKIFVGHDYQPSGRELAYETTVGIQKSSNIHLKNHTKKEDFIIFRKNRDATLDAPRLLLPSIQININAGILPQPEDNSTRYLKIPLFVKDEK